MAAIVGFRYLARHALPDAEQLSRVRRRLEPFRAVPPVRALIAELTEVGARFAATRFPFAHNRSLPTSIVRAGAGEHSLEPGRRCGLAWPDDVKRELIARGRLLTRDELRRRGLG